jgi:omega-amidase
LLKILPEKGNLDANFRKLADLVEKIPDDGIDVFITPECYLDGYVVTEERVTAKNLSRYGVSEDDGGYLEKIRGLFQGRNSWLIFGCTENNQRGAQNAAVIFNRKGDIIGKYYKIHLGGQDRKFTPGTELPVYHGDFGTFGVMICADRQWPETVRTLALKGAAVIFNPTYGMHGEKNDIMMRIRSYESEAFICFCHPLKSLITGPTGEVEAVLTSSRDHYLIHDIDLHVAEKIRKGKESRLRNRVPQVYDGLLEQSP